MKISIPYSSLVAAAAFLLTKTTASLSSATSAEEVSLLHKTSSPPEAHELSSNYSFDEYIQHFHKSYDKVKDPTLYETKKKIFESNLQLILDHNSNVMYDIKTGQRKLTSSSSERKENENHVRSSGHTYHMGVNHLMDLTQAEIESMYFGYDKSVLTKAHRRRHHNKNNNLLGSNANDEIDDDHKMDLPFEITDVSTLPTYVRHNQTTPVKNQGGCGSCWSFSSIAALESHLAIQTGELNILSTQELVSCVENPSECGGTGGCEGATAELAYNYVAENGIMKEESFPYKASDGPVCPLTPSNRFEKAMMMSTTTTKLRHRRHHRKLHNNKESSPVIAKIEGYANVPSNDYKALMNTIAKHGPAVVALAASSWSFYAGGVYSPKDPAKPINWDLNHGVVVEGYGTDEATGEDYWLVRNSWSKMWGEEGYIRLKRVDTDKSSDGDDDSGLCGYDETPLDGIGCALNPDGSKIVQHSVKVCGTNGLLFDPVIPLGGYLV